MTKNIFLIGPYRQSCSWGRACRAYIKTLVKAGLNLTLRPIYMGSSIDNNIDPFFLKLEQQKYEHYDAIIQNVLPHLIDYNSRFGKNIALFYTETGGWENTWPRKLNRMDEIWVPSLADVNNLICSNVTTPINRIPIPIDCDKFLTKYESIDELKTDTFKFYFVGELVERKNIDVLIRAFHTEFDRNEPVDLVIKINKQGMSSDQLREFFSQIINHIKKELRLYGKIEQYKQEIVIVDYLPEELLMRLHSSCDCFVMPSSGESWCMPVGDALGLGKPVIVTKHTGPEDMIPDDPVLKYAMTIDSYQEAVSVQNSPLEDLYTGCETWYKPSQEDLQTKMRALFTLHNSPRQKHMADLCAENIFKFSENSIAERIKEII